MYKESKKRLVVTRESNNPFSVCRCAARSSTDSAFISTSLTKTCCCTSRSRVKSRPPQLCTPPPCPQTRTSPLGGWRRPNLHYFICFGRSNKNELNYMDYITYPNNFSEDEYQNDKALQRKRSLRSNKSTDGVSNGNCQSEGATKAKPVSRSVAGFHTKNTSFGFSASRLIRRGRDR